MASVLEIRDEDLLASGNLRVREPINCSQVFPLTLDATHLPRLRIMRNAATRRLQRLYLASTSSLQLKRPRRQQIEETNLSQRLEN